MDVAKAGGNAKKPSGNAGKALKYISKLYKIEKEAKQKNMTIDELYTLRQSTAVPLLKEFKQWLESKVDKVPPGGLLGKAINYSLNQWHRLFNYTKDGNVGLDNNAVENAIRPFVLGRKNFLFACTPEGARASAAIYSLIETAKANGLEPYAYLRYLFHNIPEAMTTEDFKSLMPQYLDKSKIITPSISEL